MQFLLYIFIKIEIKFLVLFLRKIAHEFALLSLSNFVYESYLTLLTITLGHNRQNVDTILSI